MTTLYCVSGTSPLLTGMLEPSGHVAQGELRPRAATSSLVGLGAALALAVVAVAVIGVLGTRSAARQGNAIAGDELTTSVVTNQLARTMDAAYATGEAAMRAADPATKSRLLGTLYTSLLPAVDAQLFSLQRLHAGDPPAEHADLALFIRQWNAVRDLLGPQDLTAQRPAALAGRLTAACTSRPAPTSTA